MIGRPDPALYRLEIRLLGPVQIVLDGAPVTHFRSARTRALVAYLAAEGARTHWREHLAGLLWPDVPDSTARRNLRQTLRDLRVVLGDAALDDGAAPFILADRQTIQLTPNGDVWVDVQHFEALSSQGELEMRAALDLYRGPFLVDLSLKDSTAFAEWTGPLRQRYHRIAAGTARRLLAALESRGDRVGACDFARRWVSVDPASEGAHRELMRLLAATDRRSEALSQYEACRQALREELDVAPSAETMQLYQRIRDGALGSRSAVPRSAGAKPHAASGPAFLAMEAPVERPVFVAREPELAQLDAALQRALRGEGQVAFVTGEAGQGKTALLRAFAQQAQAAFSHLVVANGQCSAYTGAGDPYLPFREILAQLTGDVEAAWAAGSITRDQASRLWDTVPLTTQALLAHGGYLIDTFVPGDALVARARTHDAAGNAWVLNLADAITARRSPAGAAVAPTRQEDLFAQTTTVLKAVARDLPLLLLVDDLQWIDEGSAGLLFHLGQRLGGSRILLIGAYRPEEVAAGRNGTQHPLAPVAHEFGRRWGEIRVDLDKAEGNTLVAELIDSQRNRLGSTFRELLYRQTEGHPLFTLELLRGMQDQGQLVRDATGRWVEGAEIDWRALPARSEAAIQARLGRLPVSLQQALRIASVEGEVFTAEVVAQVLGEDAAAVVDRLSHDLARRHQLVRAESVRRLGDRRHSQYRFRHILFQTYLYSSLDEVERPLVHERVARALEDLHGGSEETLAEAAPQLAFQFRHAGMADEAARYYEMAAQRAVRMLAYEEAIGHYTRALEALAGLPASNERDAREVALRIAVARPTMMLKSWGAPELLEHYGRAEDLAESLEDTSGRLVVLNLVNSYYAVRAMHRRAEDSARRLLQQAERLEIPYHVMAGHTNLAIELVFLGEFGDSVAHLDRMVALYDSMPEETATNEFNADPKVGALTFAAYSYWALGYPDRALQAIESAEALAREREDPLSIYFAASGRGRLQRRRGESETLVATVDALHAIWTDFHLPMSEAEAQMNQGWLLAQQGRAKEGIPLFEQGLAIWEQTGMANHLTEFHGLLAAMYGQAGQPDRGLELIQGALAYADQTEERYHEAELYCLRGELRLQPNPDAVAVAAADFRKAIQVAQGQVAKSLELRAAMSLVRLWQDHGEADELARARAHLSEVYDWFTEGFDTRDLRNAQALLAGDRAGALHGP